MMGEKAPEAGSSSPQSSHNTAARSDSDANVLSTLEKGRSVEIPRHDDVPEIPKNNLLIVMPVIGLIAFVSALDGSIISTALPTIAAEFGASPSEYSWVGTSYLLAQTLMTPINGRLTDITGRKPALYISIVFLLVFSAMCGAAQNMTWLIVSRALAGLGGGSIVGLSMIVISDIVPLNKRGEYQGYMGGAWGVAGALGPILGGLLTEKASWRWCFYINIPICAVAIVVLFFTLNLSKSHGDVAELRRTFDFLGLFILLAGATLLIVGFSSASDNGFGVPSSYAVIVAAILVLGLAVAHALTTKRNAILPPRMLKMRTTMFFMFGSMCQSIMLYPVLFLLPQFFQGAQGASTLDSGIRLVPFSVCTALFTIVAGQITRRFHIVRPLVWAGFAIASLGYGLFSLFTPSFSLAAMMVITAIAAAGVGLSIATPMLIIQAAMPTKDMAAATSAWMLVRSMSATTGLAILTAVFNTGLRSRLESLPGYGTVFHIPTGTEGYSALHALPEPYRTSVLAAFAEAFKPCWLIGCGLLAVALILTLFTKSYSLRKTEKAVTDVPPGPEPASEGDVETSRHLGEKFSGKS